MPIQRRPPSAGPWLDRDPELALQPDNDARAGAGLACDGFRTAPPQELLDGRFDLVVDPWAAGRGAFLPRAFQAFLNPLAVFSLLWTRPRRSFAAARWKSRSAPAVNLALRACQRASSASVRSCALRPQNGLAAGLVLTHDADIRVASKQELKDSIIAVMDYFNQEPVGHTWTC